MRRAALEELRDLRGRDEVDLHAGQAVDLALVAARRPGPDDLEPGLGERGIALVHQAALGGQRPDQLAVVAIAVRCRAHGAAPCSTASSRSVWMDAPTAGTRAGAPASASKLVVAPAARDRALGAERRRDHLEHEARVVLEVAAELGGELRARQIDAGLGDEFEPALEGIEARGDVDAASAHELAELGRGLACRGFHGNEFFDQRGGLARQRRRTHVGGLAQQALGDLRQPCACRSARGPPGPGAPSTSVSAAAGLDGSSFSISARGRFGAWPAAPEVRRVELGAEGLGPPELVLEPAAPALRHVQRIDQRVEQAEIADAQLNWARPASRSAATMSAHTAASSCSRSGAANDSMPAWRNSRGCALPALPGW